MLVTSGPSYPTWHRIALDDWSDCLAIPGLSAGHGQQPSARKPRRRWSRQAVGSTPGGASPSAWRFLSHIVSVMVTSTASLRCASVTSPFRNCFDSCRSRYFHCFFRAATPWPLAAFHQVHFRFAWPDSEEPLRSVFSNAFTDIATSSIGYNFPFSFKPLGYPEQAGLPSRQKEGCASKVSRASKIVRTYPQPVL